MCQTVENNEHVRFLNPVTDLKEMQIAVFLPNYRYYVWYVCIAWETSTNATSRRRRRAYGYIHEDFGSGGRVERDRPTFERTDLHKHPAKMCMDHKKDIFEPSLFKWQLCLRDDA